jgi:hypothetical protein
MPDPNHLCLICADGKGGAEFTICPECYEQLSNGFVGLKCSGCGEYKFLARDERTKWRVQRILDLWDVNTMRICPHQGNAIMVALKEDALTKAIIIYLPSCPKCYKAGAGEGLDPNHPLTIMHYKILCFSLNNFQPHVAGEKNFSSDGKQEKIIFH